jgi:uncharacterized membrane protein
MQPRQKGVALAQEAWEKTHFRNCKNCIFSHSISKISFTMNTTHLLITFLVSISVLVIFDLIWIGIIAKKFYRKQLDSIMSSSVNWWAAAVFYLLYTLGLMVFVIVPGMEHGNILRVFLMGALFGLIAYGTYNLTNLATLKDFGLKMVLFDMPWGAALTATISYFAFLTLNYLG